MSVRFDWVAFLKKRSIPFVTKGPNTARSAVSIRCPWCGDADPSQHMGLSKVSGVWGCLRNSAHRGKDPARLVQKLLGCSPEEARRLVGGTATPAPAPDMLRDSVARLRRLTHQENAPLTSLRLPKEFRPLPDGSRFEEPFLEYLEGRGFRRAQIAWLGASYGLQYAVRGRFAYRVIIPIMDRYGTLLSWTARTILPETQPRYKTLRVSPDEDAPTGPVALLSANHTVLGLPVLYEAQNPKVLVLVEGPLDALKLTAFGHTLGLYAAALFGLNVYPEQVGVLLSVAARFERVYLLVDKDAEFQRLRLLRALAGCRAQLLSMPFGCKDPGEFTAQQVVEFCFNLGL